MRPLYGDYSEPYDCSHLFIAIDVRHFCDLAIFKPTDCRRRRTYPHGARAPGVAELFAPGETEWRARAASDGSVDPSPVVAMLTRYASELDVMDTPFQERQERSVMPKIQITSPKLRQPNGVFSHAT